MVAAALASLEAEAAAAQGLDRYHHTAGQGGGGGADRVDADTTGRGGTRTTHAFVGRCRIGV